MKNYIIGVGCLLTLIGCVGPQTQQAFAFRKPAYTWQGTLSPNRAEERDNKLNRAINRAAEYQEAEEKLDWSYAEPVACNTYDVDSDTWICP